MKNKDKKNLTIVAVTLVVAVLGLTIVFATLSTNLSITFGSDSDNAITQKGAQWKIAFDTTSPTVDGTKSGYSAVTCGTANVTEEGVTLSSVALYTPGDSCTYSVKVKNDGDLNAKLNSFTWTKPEGGASCTESTTNTYKCGDITYSVLKAGSALETNEKLASKGSVDLTIKVSYDGASVSAKEVKRYNGKVQLNWVQD